MYKYDPPNVAIRLLLMIITLSVLIESFTVGELALENIPCNRKSKTKNKDFIFIRYEKLFIFLLTNINKDNLSNDFYKCF
tara:strand:- start:308 stop:547 length:240 start_codon:yes stop_codon:yes gene_type:complete